MQPHAATEIESMKRRAAVAAVAEIQPGMVVGLGTGSTAAFAVAALAARVATGLTISAIPTSERTAALAREAGIPLTTFAAHPAIDLTIDGADQIERGSLNLIKGGGGALLREKIVASASRRLIIIADETKLVDRLGGTQAVPVEVIPFGHEALLPRLAALDLTPALRLIDGRPFVTDSGNYILDCAVSAVADARSLERHLASCVGVVESGLFTGLASRVIIGRRSATDVIDA